MEVPEEGGSHLRAELGPLGVIAVVAALIGNAGLGAEDDVVERSLRDLREVAGCHVDDGLLA